jgi:hypothetical protein
MLDIGEGVLPEEWSTRLRLLGRERGCGIAFRRNDIVSSYLFHFWGGGGEEWDERLRGGIFNSVVGCGGGGGGGVMGMMRVLV